MADRVWRERCDARFLHPEINVRTTDPPTEPWTGVMEESIRERCEEELEHDEERKKESEDDLAFRTQVRETAPGRVHEIEFEDTHPAEEFIQLTREHDHHDLHEVQEDLRVTSRALGRLVEEEDIHPAQTDEDEDERHIVFLLAPDTFSGPFRIPWFTTTAENVQIVPRARVQLHDTILSTTTAPAGTVGTADQSRDPERSIPPQEEILLRDDLSETAQGTIPWAGVAFWDARVVVEGWMVEVWIPSVLLTLLQSQESTVRWWEIILSSRRCG